MSYHRLGAALTDEERIAQGWTKDAQGFWKAPGYVAPPPKSPTAVSNKVGIVGTVSTAAKTIPVAAQEPAETMVMGMPVPVVIAIVTAVTILGAALILRR